MWIFNKKMRQFLLLDKKEILQSVDAVDKKVSEVLVSINDVFRDLVTEVESLRVALAGANADKERLYKQLADKQAKIDELNGVLGGALELVRRATN